MVQRLTTFLWQFARSPIKTGAVAPSSHRLAHAMVDNLGVERADVVFEFGAGTGSFTVEIIERMKPGAAFVAVEINPCLARHLRARFPEIHVMDDSAENAARFRAQRGIGPIDCIVCGLPWAGFPSRLQDRLLDSVLDNLKPGGRFATFAYAHACWLPQGRRIHRKLFTRFAGVYTTPLVWRNLPPAFVYKCQKSWEVDAPEPRNAAAPLGAQAAVPPDGRAILRPGDAQPARSQEERAGLPGPQGAAQGGVDSGVLQGP